MRRTLMGGVRRAAANREVRVSANASPQVILWAISGALVGYMEDMEQADDATCVVINRD
jgi:hypothetical protein